MSCSNGSKPQETPAESPPLTHIYWQLQNASVASDDLVGREPAGPVVGEYGKMWKLKKEHLLSSTL